MARLSDLYRRGLIDQATYENLLEMFSPDATISNPDPRGQNQYITMIQQVGVTGGDHHRHKDGDGGQISHQDLNGLEDDNAHRQYVMGLYPSTQVVSVVGSPGTDDRIPTERAIRTELDRLLGQSGIVTAIRQYNDTSDGKVPSERAVRSELDAINSRLLALEVKA